MTVIIFTRSPASRVILVKYKPADSERPFHLFITEHDQPETR